MQGVYVKTYPAPPFDGREALRYAGYLGQADGATQGNLRACLQETDFSYRVCYAVLTRAELYAHFGRESEAWLSSRLAGAEQAVLFCATVGLGVDRAIYANVRIAPTKGLLLQAVGTERVESLCDAFCQDLAAEYAPLRVGKRFSPGYGNIPLETQKTVFSLLDCSRKIGVALNESLLMTPSKSVTAFVPVGILQED